MKKKSLPEPQLNKPNIKNNAKDIPKEVTKNQPFPINAQKKEISIKPEPKANNKVPKFEVKQSIPINKPAIKPNVGSKQVEKMIKGAKKGIKVPGTLRLTKQKDSSKQVAAVIVTFNNGSSYDNLFRSVEQNSLEGTQVLVYAGQAQVVNDIYQGMREQPTTEAVKQLLENIKGVDPDCVVFNWECCSGYGQCKFTENAKTVMCFLQMILNAGHMAMFSDFSLKALIQQWDQTLLGKNPFVRTGQTGAAVTLKFNPASLKQSPSAQLQIVGDMAEGGKCHIHTLNRTILYSVNPDKIDHQRYKLDVLTINTNNIPQIKEYVLQIQDQTGSAGHVLLTYKSGGMILTSMGHWIELMKIDTNQKKIFELAKEEYGQEEAAKMQAEYKEMDVASKKKYVEAQSIKYVQSQAPCANMSKKAKKMKM